MSLADAGVEKGILGVSTSGDWRATVVDGGTTTATNEADFLATWSRLSRDVSPSAIRSALRWEQAAGQSGPKVTLEIKEEQPPWQVEQEINATLDPIWKVTTLEGRIRVKPNPSRRGPLVMELPAGAKLVRASGAQLHDWIEQLESVSFFLKSRGVEPTVLELTIRIPWELTSRRVAGRTTRSLEPPRWSDAESTLTRWQVQTTSGWILSGLDTAGSKEPAPGETLVRQVNGVEPISVQLAPEPRELSAEMLTRVVVRDRQTEIEGIIQIHVDKGTLGRLELRTRGGLRNIQWEVDKMSPPTSEERGGERIWVYRAGRSLTGDVTLRWRTSKLSMPVNRRFRECVIDAPARVRDWVSIVNLTDQKMTLATPGLSANPLPPTLSSLGGSLSGESSSGVQTF